MSDPFYRTVYHRNDWTIADAFRPQPGWGQRRFTAPVAAMGDLTELQILAAALEAAPDGHRLTRLSVIPGDAPERVIWSTPPDRRFAAQGESKGGTPHG